MPKDIEGHEKLWYSYKKKCAIHVTNSWADVHKSLNSEMLPLHSGILAKAISIASSSLQQMQSMSLALLLQRPYSRSSRPELFCKKVVLENFAKFIVVSSGTGVSCEFCNILKNNLFCRAPPVAASGICTNQGFLF